jgi:hypothetical protein
VIWIFFEELQAGADNLLSKLSSGEDAASSPLDNFDKRLSPSQIKK